MKAKAKARSRVTESERAPSRQENNPVVGGRQLKGHGDDGQVWSVMRCRCGERLRLKAQSSILLFGD